MGTNFMQPALRTSLMQNERSTAAPGYVARQQGMDASKYIAAAQAMNNKPIKIAKRGPGYPKVQGGF
jgi:hypothetical protein